MTDTRFHTAKAEYQRGADSLLRAVDDRRDARHAAMRGDWEAFDDCLHAAKAQEHDARQCFEAFEALCQVTRPV